ncbi:helix-turn-helix transcriptional regulator [Actinoplanes solisilvae]|uniref:helix-turn-helix transcriptional regulator n=1 Tax=Actinoplanes solisilvae TaxID=2486853 RepID=UPI000FD7D1DD|nr:LuxR family transcriptional regulator [Actinoplanes solisilvae]
MDGLTGRGEECALLDRLISAVGAGESRVLVVRGQAGVGKTALLDHVSTHATGCRVLRIVGVQAEMELPYAGLHQLLAPSIGVLQRLPKPQQRAVGTAFGLSPGPTPDRFLVALAVLGLLSEVAAERPLLCLVDDEQWLDRASALALAFVARRIAADSIGLIFGTRHPGEELAGLPELVVEGLRDDDSRTLLESALAAPLDPRVRDLIVAEAQGNPLALLELPRGLSPAELAGGFGLPSALPVPVRIENSFERQLDSLPAATRRLLTLAAADPSGDPLLVWRAAERLDIPAGAAGPATERGLAEFGARVRFRHPLVRSAAYRSAPLDDRRRAHAVLAEVTDPATEPDRRAWHRAQAAEGADEDVAAELERSAGRAEQRGGLAAAAAFRERAALLTPDPGRRVGRLLAAARAAQEAGTLDAARELLVLAEAGPLDPLHTAEIDHLRGLLALDEQRDGVAVPLLLSAAKLLEPLDAGRARQTYLEALMAAVGAGELGAPGGMRAAAEGALATPTAPGPPRPVDLVIDGLARWKLEGHTAAAGALRRALEPVLPPQAETFDAGSWLRLIVGGSHLAIALEVWDFEAWRSLAQRQVKVTRELGALVQLQVALNHLGGVHLLSGEPGVTERLMDECNLVAEANGSRPDDYTLVILAAWQGRDAHASALIETAIRNAAGPGVGQMISSAGYASAVLNNGLGRHDVALVAARQAFLADEFGFGPQVVPEFAEAAARTGDTDAVQAALDWMAGRTRVTRTDWALGLDARIQALAAEGDEADQLYRFSIERLGRTPIRTQLARSHLLYGEWLRRRGRRVDAREQLRTAHHMLDDMGMAAFADRARRELLATGATARKRAASIVPDGEKLTSQEAEVARLARDGLSNPEIGARLFISSRTAQYHLRKVFAKLGVSSRSQLHRVLPDASLHG